MQFTSSSQRESSQANRRIAQDLAKFRESNEGWFDGTPHSVDRRLATCNALLTRARGAVARSPFDWEPSHVIAELQVDQRALVGLKQDLLTGWADRVVDVAPARQQRVAFSPIDPPSHINESLKPLWRQDVENGVDPMQRHLPEQHRRQAAAAPTAPRQGPTPWDEEAGDWAVPSLEHDMTGGGASRSFVAPQPKYDPPGFKKKLTSGEVRWVSLEAPRFVRANADCADYFSELAIRAEHHAKVASSTSDNSPAITRAFVAAVIETARRSPAPKPVRTAAADDCSDIEDHSVMFL